MAASPALHGVLVAMAGKVHAGDRARKVHSHRLDAFASRKPGPLARVEGGRVRVLHPVVAAVPYGLAVLPEDLSRWPAVEIVTSCAGARPQAVDALVASGARGLVVASTGNGTVHHVLEAALIAAQANGVAVRRSTRCLDGGVIGTGPAGTLAAAGALTPVQARIELMLELMAYDASRPAER